MDLKLDQLDMGQQQILKTPDRQERLWEGADAKWDRNSDATDAKIEKLVYWAWVVSF